MRVKLLNEFLVRSQKNFTIAGNQKKADQILLINVCLQLKHGPLCSDRFCEKLPCLVSSEEGTGQALEGGAEPKACELFRGLDISAPPAETYTHNYHPTAGEKQRTDHSTSLCHKNQKHDPLLRKGIKRYFSFKVVHKLSFNLLNFRLISQLFTLKHFSNNCEYKYIVLYIRNVKTDASVFSP